MSFAIKFAGIAAFDKGMKEIRKAIEKPYKAYRQIQFIMLRDIDQHFRDQAGPTGKWDKLKPRTLKRRRKGGAGAKILQDTGRLKQSIRTRVTARDVAIGTNLRYAATHQFGDRKRNIPQRQFLWFSRSAQQRALDRFVALLRGQL